MVRNLLVFLVLMGFVFSILPPVVATVDYCQVINAPGEYTLTKDLTGVNGTNSYCIRIEVGDVMLDCDGHTITGTGTGEGVNIKNSYQPNVTVQNCNISQYNYAIYGDLVWNGSILDNDLYDSNNNNLYISGSYNNIEGNLIHTSGAGQDGAVVNGDSNTFTGNEFYGNGYGGLELNGENNHIEDNEAHDNGGSGFNVDGSLNEFIGNTAYGNDWEYFEGAGFESDGANTFDDNTAYDNTNGFYLVGPLPEPVARRIPVFGNTFTNNWAHGNLVGLNFIDNNGTYTDNTLEENYEADMLMGGDAWLGVIPLGSDALRGASIDFTLICDNTVERNTGSGARPIYYSGETVTLNGGTYSEVLLCNAVNSVITGVTVDGSNTLNNNGMLLFLSNGTKISDSKSQNNFMGFGFVRSSDATLSNSNSDGSGFGVFSMQTMNLAIDGLTSNNNRMNATIILDILMGFLGGGPLAGEVTLRAPAPEINELGAGAVLIQSPRATITDSTFSGSTFGLALMMSDEATISGGSAHTNDVFGYGLLDSYNVNFESFALAYNNAGDIHDIFIGTVPPAYEMLEFLPFGVGVLDISLGMILEPVTARGEPLRALTTCWSYNQCGLDRGMICNFDTQTCEEGIFENTYSNMRVYNNHYGMVLFNLGHELVDGCRVYDNHVFGLLDASDPVSFMPLSAIVLEPNVESVTIRNSYFYRNGEQMFSVLSELYEEGDKPAWAEAFALFDSVIPTGVLELEIIEASYFNSMILPLTALEYAGEWKLEETTVGTGASSVRMSLDDNATAIYLVHDTTLPTVNSIHMESEDLGVNMTIYLDIDDTFVGPRSSYNNKYFTIAALTESVVLAAPVSPTIEKFIVHYSPSGGYDPETMGLYYLQIREIVPYCEEDIECDRGQVCSQNTCITPECYTDEDCPPVVAADAPQEYCVDYMCVYCRDDADCAGGEDCSRCMNGKCKQNACLGDVDCLEGCECEANLCSLPRIASADGSCGAPIDDYVLLRGAVEEQEVIMKARWVPVAGQINNDTEKTITVYDFAQTDQTEFLEMILGSLPVAADPVEYSLYFDIYGLFAVREPVQPGGGDGKPDYVCEEDVDCPECYYCSIDNNACLPKSDVECGVPGTGCSNGYECVACECVKEAEPPEEECEIDNDCPGNEYCDDGECMLVPCDCGEVKDHECIAHPCCSNDDCDAGLVCKDNKCVEAEAECTDCDEPIAEAENLIKDAKEKGLDTSVAERLLADAKEAKANGDCEEALKFANAALAAAEDLFGEEVTFPPVISTEVPSVESPQQPNGTEVSDWQQDIAWIILIILGLALVGFWWFRNYYGK